MKTVKPTLTAARLAWLRKLATGTARQRPHGRTGFDCYRLGWTDWDPVGPREVLTPAGLAVLQAHDRKEDDDYFIEGAIHD